MTASRGKLCQPFRENQSASYSKLSPLWFLCSEWMRMPAIRMSVAAEKAFPPATVVWKMVNVYAFSWCIQIDEPWSQLCGDIDATYPIWIYDITH